MICTLENAFKRELPPAILRAQYRASKLLIEHDVPTRLLETFHYLIGITSLDREGRVHYSRTKLSVVLNISERTVDRNILLLENAGLLFRRIRSHVNNGWFYGSSIQWSAQTWHNLFIARPRSQDIAAAQAGLAANERTKANRALVSPADIAYGIAQRRIQHQPAVGANEPKEAIHDQAVRTFDFSGVVQTHCAATEAEQFTRVNSVRVKVRSNTPVGADHVPPIPGSGSAAASHNPPPGQATLLGRTAQGQSPEVAQLERPRSGMESDGQTGTPREFIHISATEDLFTRVNSPSIAQERGSSASTPRVSYSAWSMPYASLNGKINGRSDSDAGLRRGSNRDRWTFSYLADPCGKEFTRVNCYDWLDVGTLQQRSNQTTGLVKAPEPALSRGAKFTRVNCHGMPYLGAPKTRSDLTSGLVDARQPTLRRDEQFTRVNCGRSLDVATPEPKPYSAVDPVRAPVPPQKEKFTRVNRRGSIAANKHQRDGGTLDSRNGPTNPAFAEDERFTRVNCNEIAGTERPGACDQSPSHGTDLTNNTGCSSIELPFIESDIHKQGMREARKIADLKTRKTKHVRLPSGLGEWVSKLELDDKSVWMLLGIAKRTDLQKTGRRLQEALELVGPRLVDQGLKGESAGRYLYRCIANGIDFVWKKAAQGQDAAEAGHASWLSRAKALVLKAFEHSPVRELSGRRFECIGSAVYIKTDHGLAVLLDEAIAKLAVRLELCEPWEA